MNLWILNIRTASAPGTNPKAFCLDRGIMGVGWPVYTTRDSLTEKQILKLARTRYAGGGKKFPGGLRAMVEVVQIDDLVWLRDDENIYHLGRVLSDWRYVGVLNAGDEWDDNDIHNIRDVEWHQIGTAESVPWGIRKHFGRGTLKGINVDGDRMLRFSQATYNKLPSETKRSDAKKYAVHKAEDKNIFSLIGPDACEDVVALYLQHRKGYHMVPSTSKATTKHYEFVLLHPDGHRALVQVKNGIVPLCGTDYRSLLKNDTRHKTKFYLFTLGSCDTEGIDGVECIARVEIEAFMTECPELLPQAVQLWISTNC